jgi:hypothetical protein
MNPVMADAKKALGKGIAIATMVAAAVALAHALKKNKKARLLKAAARDAKEHVIAHAKKLGGVSKQSYAKIVDAVMAEYAKMKTLSKQEIADLSHELKDGWDETAKMLKKKR